MPIQFSDAVRNARADTVESTTGAAARLQLRTGAPPFAGSVRSSQEKAKPLP